MTVKLTIIGLGKIGTSVGLALAAHTGQIERTGHDLHPEHARRAHKMGAIDRVAYNLPASVADADIVLLALPVDQMRETLELIAPDLKEGAVVLETSPVKQAVMAWGQEFLQAGRYLVGLTLVPNPRYLYDTGAGGEAARADFFQQGLTGIVAPRGTVSAAIKLATDFIGLLGSKPLFMDLVEADSLMAAVHLLPQLLAAGLASATIDQPGWLEGRKLAGAVFALGSSPLSVGDPPEALLSAAQLSQEHVVRLLDRLIDQLAGMRDRLSRQEGEWLLELLQSASEGRRRWEAQSKAGDWQDQLPRPELPDAGSEMRRWLFGKRRDS